MFSQNPVKWLLLRCAATVGRGFGMGVGERHAAHGCKMQTSGDTRVPTDHLQHSP
jgi:hypothetical protein